MCNAIRREAKRLYKWVYPFETSRFFMLYLCYIDESGTSSIPGNTGHYVLCSVSIPVKYWKTYTQKINKIKKKYRLENTEIRTGWILRKYTEQARSRISTPFKIKIGGIYLID